MESDAPDDAPECWCPCLCGCQDWPGSHDNPFLNGQCNSCVKGLHEIPPWFHDAVPRFHPTLDEAIAATESYLAQLRKIQSESKNG